MKTKSKVHMHKSTFGYAVAIDGHTMPMDVSYNVALMWMDRLKHAGLESGPIPPPGPDDAPYEPVGDFAAAWKKTERWTMRSGDRGLTVLEGPVGVNEIARLLEHAIHQKQR